MRPEEIGVEESKRFVEEGGVSWKCETCGTRGVFLAGSPYAVEARRKFNKPAPELIGIFIEKEEKHRCPICNPGTIQKGRNPTDN